MAELSIFPDNITTKVDPGTSILGASLDAGIPHTHLCGGKSRCSTCRVLIIEGIENCSQRNEREQEIADGLHYPPSLRLACQTTIAGDVSLRRLVVDQEDIALTSQLVVERVRAEVMAMRGSDDFVNIVRVLWQGLLDVGLDVDYCALDILDEDPNTCETHAITASWIEEWCDTAPLIRSVVAGGHYYCSHHLLNDHQQDVVLRREQVVAAWSPEEERAEYLSFIRHCWNGPNAVRAPAPQSWITVPFSHGRISVHSFEPEQFLQQDRQLIEIFADAVSLAYTRLLDFRHLEAQHTEIQLAYGKLKETQAELVQAEKMAALGELVAGVAHEINTPLGAIKSTIDTAIRGIERVEKLAVEEPPDPEKVATIFGRITHLHRIMQDAVERIDLIVGNLRKFARLDAPELDTVNVHEGIDSTLLIVAHELKNRIEVTKDYGVIPEVQCYPNQLNQVFMNILVNAGQAIDGNGKITIKTFRRDDDVVISFTDTGRGIRPDHLQRIFDPGFTTKGVGVGMGLGLSIVHQIIESHHGRIEVDSQPGEGTTLQIVAPVLQPVEKP